MGMVSVITRPAYNNEQRRKVHAELRAAGHKIVAEQVTPIGLKLWIVPMEAKDDGQDSTVR